MTSNPVVQCTKQRGHWVDPESEKNETCRKPQTTNRNWIGLSMEDISHATESQEWRNTFRTMVTRVWYNLKLPPVKENHHRKWKLCKVQRQLMSRQRRITTVIRDCGLGWAVARNTAVSPTDVRYLLNDSYFLNSVKFLKGFQQSILLIDVLKIPHQ